MELRVQDSGLYRVQGVGVRYRVWDLGLVSGLGSRFSGLGSKYWSRGFRITTLGVWILGFRLLLRPAGVPRLGVYGLGFFKGLGFRVQGLGIGKQAAGGGGCGGEGPEGGVWAP